MRFLANHDNAAEIILFLLMQFFLSSFIFWLYLFERIWKTKGKSKFQKNSPQKFANAIRTVVLHVKTKYLNTFQQDAGTQPGVS